MRNVFLAATVLIAVLTSQSALAEQQPEPTLPIPPPPAELTKDGFPVTFSATFDNQGYRAYGLSQWTVGGTWSHIGGSDQSLSYQFTRSFSGLYSSHAVTYTVPLPWKDKLVLSGSYSAELNNNGTIFAKTGLNFVVSPRYVHDLPPTKLSDHLSLVQDFQIGYDFKTNNDNSLLIDSNLFGSAEVDQFPLIYDATITDPWGETVLTNTLVLSPGSLNNSSSTENFRRFWESSTAHYVYDIISLSRTTKLPGEFSWVARAQAQIASGNLPSSEQTCLGGMKYVRGYTANGYCDSQGVVVSTEVWSPPFHLGSLASGSASVKDSEQIGLFVDYGQARSHTAALDQHLALASVGPALRASAGPYMDFAFDAGVQLIAPPVTPGGTPILPALRKQGIFCDFSLTMRY